MIKRNSKMILVTGSARSGTTLLADCLNHHPQIMCVADAMNEFFKGFMKYAYYKLENEKKDSGYPIDNFFFSGSSRVREFINQTDLEHKIPEYLRKEILQRMVIRDGSYCPEIIEPVKQLQAKTFARLFLEILRVLHSLYGSEQAAYFGIKTLWCEQLILPLARTFPNMVFVNIIRDPRAVVASNYVTKNNRYPLLFTIRDWRKSVYYSWKFPRMKLLKHRFIAIKYEDLVAAPERTLSGITSLIGTRYDPAMTNHVFKEPNTSYRDQLAEPGISARFTEKWKQTLPKDIIKKVENFAFSEMNKKGYRNFYLKSRLDLNNLLSLKDVPYQSLSDWCKDIVRDKKNYEQAWLLNNTLLEVIRANLINAPDLTEDQGLLDKFFYEKDFYLWLKGKRSNV
ncbi:sulfotransferase [Candidatus Omnitrophota bacterium]